MTAGHRKVVVRVVSELGSDEGVSHEVVEAAERVEGRLRSRNAGREGRAVDGGSGVEV